MIKYTFIAWATVFLSPPLLASADLYYFTGGYGSLKENTFIRFWGPIDLTESTGQIEGTFIKSEVSGGEVNLTMETQGGVHHKFKGYASPAPGEKRSFCIAHQIQAPNW